MYIHKESSHNKKAPVLDRITKKFVIFCFQLTDAYRSHNA